MFAFLILGPSSSSFFISFSQLFQNVFEAVGAKRKKKVTKRRHPIIIAAIQKAARDGGQPTTHQAEAMTAKAHVGRWGSQAVGSGFA